jgi:septal ring factor EnvC (AmiA/AmiB activator)
MIDCLVAQILELYPEIKLKSKRADHVKHVILSHYSQDFQDLDSLSREIKERDQLRREQKHKNEEATRLLADLECKVQAAEQDRTAIRQECEGLTRQIEEM